MPKKGEKLGRKSPRQRGSTEIMPYKPPRKVTNDKEVNDSSAVQAMIEAETTESTPYTPLGSDTTGSTPDVCKSPDVSEQRVPGSCTTQTDVFEEFEIQARPQAKYKGVKIIAETEIQESSGDSEDDIPMARLLQPKTVSGMSRQ
jgi:hypothetical protein